jgi:uncharacterized protein
MNTKVIEETEGWVNEYMKKYDYSHDFNHVIRVKNMAIKISETERISNVDLYEIILGALTHDICDSKYCDTNDNQELTLRQFFKDKLHDKDVLDNVVYIACNISLSKQCEQCNECNECDSELFIRNKYKIFCVRDADRLDSLGSIGISRYFIFGIIKNNSTIEDIVRNLENRTEKLINSIHTDYGKKIAENKHNLIKLFLEDFKKSI